MTTLAIVLLVLCAVLIVFWLAARVEAGKQCDRADRAERELAEEQQRAIDRVCGRWDDELKAFRERIAERVRYRTQMLEKMKPENAVDVGDVFVSAVQKHNHTVVIRIIAPSRKTREELALAVGSRAPRRLWLSPEAP